MIRLISNTSALDYFRGRWPGERVLDLVRNSDKPVLISWPIGVGKSYNLDRVIEAAIARGDYELIIALLSRRELIEARPMVQAPPSGLKVVNLRPRPGDQCGEANDKLWSVFHRSGLGLLGRRTICQPCPNFDGCFWPDQYSKGLMGANLVFGTHQHLEMNPQFLLRVKRTAGASRMLVLIDEAAFVAHNRNRQIYAHHLKMYLTAIAECGANSQAGLQKYLKVIRRIHNSTEARLLGSWQLPVLELWQVLAVQEKGWERFGPDYRYLGYELEQLIASRPLSRERSPERTISYTTSPIAVPDDVAIYSGTANPRFTSFRLGASVAVPFINYSFLHEGTRWYNLADMRGAKEYFSGNSSQILDFFAGLMAIRLDEGKRCMAVSKDRFKYTCIRDLESRLRDLGHPDAVVLDGLQYQPDIHGPKVIPVINYGVVGINTFEHIDCAYCLNSYFVYEQIVDEILQDVFAGKNRIGIRIRTEGQPARRSAGAANKKDEKFRTHRLASLALEHQEMEVVLQAVGRVRPYTKPREVITFQCSDHPTLTYTAEFNTLAEARTYFGVQTRQERRSAQTRARVQAAKAKGLTQRMAAQETGLSLSTVKCYWKKRRG